MLEALFAPDTVAVLGASAKPGKVGYEIVRNLLRGGFAGTVVPVNPGAASVLDLQCYPSLSAYPGRIDLAIVAVPTDAVLDAARQSIAAGAKAIVVITAGFREIGPEGARLEAEVARVCREGGARLLGPNCVGVIDAHRRMNATFASHDPEPGGMSVISQSGAVCTALLDWAAHRHIGLAKLASVGNKADLSEKDLLPALAEDPDTKVILLYLESVDDGDAFLRAAEAASARKPVAALKVGTSQAGRKAASSHTGSLAGADTAYGAAFARAGVIRAEGFEALLDAGIAFAMQPLPKGRRVAIVTNAGGPGIMAADAVERAGLQTTQLGRGTVTALRRKLPAAAAVENPIDVLGDADPERYAAALAAALAEPSVDAAVVILTPQAMTRPAEVARAVAKAARGAKPVLAAFMGGEDVMPGRAELAAASLPSYPSPERAVAALEAMVRYAEWRARPPREVKSFPADPARVRAILDEHFAAGLVRVSEPAAKRVLAAYGVEVLPGALAGTADEAAAAAERAGFPAAMKIVSPDIVHKTDLGGVRLDLADAEAVRDAFDLMMLRVARRAPEARIDGVYVERMAPPGREVIVGMTRDPQFGPMLMFGLGGIFVEAMKDVAFHLAPVTEDEAMRMLRSTRSYAILAGARGQAPVNLAGVADALQRISRLTADFPEIRELDVNPMIVPEGDAPPVAADARMILIDVCEYPPRR